MSSKLSFSIPSSKSKPKPKPIPQPNSDANEGAAAAEEETTSSKLSFAIPSSRSRPRLEGKGARNDDENKSKLFVTEFDSSKTLDDGGKGKSVIAPIQNTWRPTKRMKNLELPLTEAANSEEIGFVVESLPTAGDGGDEGITYGLNVREKSGRDEHGDTDRMLLEKLRYDMENLPEDRGMEEFEDMPVEGFGAALLAGYGWKEGQVIGRNKNREDVKVKQYEKRAGKLGLGFMPDKPGTKDRDRYKEGSRDRKDEGGSLSRKDERDSRSRKDKDERDSRSRKDKDDRDSRSRKDKDDRDSRSRKDKEERDSRSRKDKEERDSRSRKDKKERDSRSRKDKDERDSRSRKGERDSH